MNANEFAANKSAVNKFWKWTNTAETETGGERVLELNGVIAEESWFDDDVTPAQFKEELYAGEGPVTVWINSPGGDCIAASRIYSMLAEYPGEVTVKIDGIAASAASVVAMAGTKVLMAPTSIMMIHNPATAAFGDHNEMAKAIEMLDEVKESIINAYEIKTGLTRAKISHLMESETWMNAKKAMELGFADGMLEDGKQSPAVTEAYAYSSRTAEAALYNRITEKTRQETPVKHGRSVNDLMERLSLLTY